MSCLPFCLGGIHFCLVKKTTPPEVRTTNWPCVQGNVYLHVCTKLLLICLFIVLLETV